MFAMVASVSQSLFAQTNSQPAPSSDVVVITGTRFTYPLIQAWIDEYRKEKPHVQIIIEWRGMSDPESYDVLVEVFESGEILSSNREYTRVARYAILPVANAKSAIARDYGEKGLDNRLIKRIFFQDLFTDGDDRSGIKIPYTVYTRLQSAGAPYVFAKHFGYTQRDIKGNAIAGSDEHLRKAILLDTSAVSYLPLPLIYDLENKVPVEGLTVLPIDIDGNGRVANGEKFYGDLSTVQQRLEQEGATAPAAYVHLSVSKEDVKPEAKAFLEWVVRNGERYLHDFGYLTLDGKNAGVLSGSARERQR